MKRTVRYEVRAEVLSDDGDWCPAYNQVYDEADDAIDYAKRMASVGMRFRVVEVTEVEMGHE